MWEWDVGERFCVLDGLTGVTAERAGKGLSRRAAFGAKAAFRMSARHRRHTALADNLSNMDREIVVSRRLKDRLEEFKPRDVEFLPVSIVNHWGWAASRDYFVVHPLGQVDCIDTARSVYRWNAIDPDKMSACSRLVLDPDRIDPDRLLFRPRHLGHHVLVRPDLAASLAREGFTGLLFTPLDAFET